MPDDLQPRNIPRPCVDLQPTQHVRQGGSIQVDLAVHLWQSVQLQVFTVIDYESVRATAIHYYLINNNNNIVDAGAGLLVWHVVVLHIVLCRLHALGRCIADQTLPPLCLHLPPPWRLQTLALPSWALSALPTWAPLWQLATPTRVCQCFR